AARKATPPGAAGVGAECEGPYTRFGMTRSACTVARVCSRSGGRAMWLWCLALGAMANPSLESRLAEVEALRPLRLGGDVPPIPAEAYLSVARGNVETGLMDVEGYSAKKAWGAAIVDVPIARYWAAINDDPGKKS